MEDDIDAVGGIEGKRNRVLFLALSNESEKIATDRAYSSIHLHSPGVLHPASAGIVRTVVLIFRRNDGIGPKGLTCGVKVVRGCREVGKAWNSRYSYAFGRLRKDTHGRNMEL